MIPYLDILYFAILNSALVFTGYFLVHGKMLVASWMLLIVSIVAVHLIFLNDAPLIRMLAIIAITFTATKAVVTCQAYQYKAFNLAFMQWLAFNLGWAGMRAEPFTTLGVPALKNAGKMVMNGIIRAFIGALLIFLAQRVNAIELQHGIKYVVITMLCLIGLSFILHFGILAVSAGMWRFSGADTYYLFRQPARSGSLQEFWGKRWNLAFIEMVTIMIYRPLKQKTGNTTALVIAFAFSGILHELAISVPVKQGYGLPMLYFLVQALAMWLERILKQLRPQLFANNIFNKAWLLFWLIAPFPLLFHTAFINKVIFPLVGIPC